MAWSRFGGLAILALTLASATVLGAVLGMSASCASLDQLSGGGADAAEAAVVDAPKDQNQSQRDGAPVDGAGDTAAAPDAPMTLDGPTTLDASACGQSSICTPLPPVGWLGPVELFEGSGSPLPTAPPCSATYPTDLYDGFGSLNAPPALCGCVCGPPSTITCGPLSMSLFMDAVCTSTPCGAPVSLPPNTCVDTPGGNGCPGYAQVGTSMVSGGACNPMANVTITPPSWGSAARLCGTGTPPIQGSCPTGAACVAPPSLPYSTKPCILSSGQTACPAGSGYSVPHVYYSGVTEGRTCTACTCASTASCTGSIQYPCNGPFTLTLGQACEQTMGATSYQFNLTPTGGDCTPGTPTPTGMATPTGAMTVCCTP